jgi:anthranilate synthase component II
MILIIDNYDSFTHNLYQAFSSLSPDEIKVVRNDALTLDEIASYNPKAIVLSPGPGKPKEAGICLDLIRRFASQIPILGVCLGHQAIAEAFGADLSYAPTIVHGKHSHIFHRGEGILKNLPSPFLAGRYHSLIVSNERIPNEIIVQAVTEEGTIMAIRHGTYPVFGVQFHPESILTPDGEAILRNFLEEAENVALTH